MEIVAGIGACSNNKEHGERSHHPTRIVVDECSQWEHATHDNTKKVVE
jgi:hypothetical protein